MKKNLKAKTVKNMALALSVVMASSSAPISIFAESDSAKEQTQTTQDGSQDTENDQDADSSQDTAEATTIDAPNATATAWDELKVGDYFSDSFGFIYKKLEAETESPAAEDENATAERAALVGFKADSKNTNLTGLSTDENTVDMTDNTKRLTLGPTKVKVTELGDGGEEGEEGTKIFTDNGNGKTVKVGPEITAINKGALAGFAGTIEDLDNMEGLVTIEENAFKGATAQITSLTLNTALTTIGNSAFENVGELADLNTIDATGLVTLGEDIFKGTQIEEVDLSAAEDLVSIGALFGTEANANNGKTFTLGEVDSLENISQAAFAGAILKVTATSGTNSEKSFDLPDTLSNIGPSAFEGTDIQENADASAPSGRARSTVKVKLNSNVKNIGIGAKAFVGQTLIGEVNVSSTVIGNAFASGEASETDKKCDITGLTFVVPSASEISLLRIIINSSALTKSEVKVKTGSAKTIKELKDSATGLEGVTVTSTIKGYDTVAGDEKFRDAEGTVYQKISAAAGRESQADGNVKLISFNKETNDPESVISNITEDESTKKSTLGTVTYYSDPQKTLNITEVGDGQNPVYEKQDDSARAKRSTPDADDELETLVLPNVTKINDYAFAMDEQRVSLEFSQTPEVSEKAFVKDVSKPSEIKLTINGVTKEDAENSDSKLEKIAKALKNAATSEGEAPTISLVVGAENSLSEDDKKAIDDKLQELVESGELVGTITNTKGEEIQGKVVVSGLADAENDEKEDLADTSLSFDTKGLALLTELEKLENAGINKKSSVANNEQYVFDGFVVKKDGQKLEDTGITDETVPNLDKITIEATWKVKVKVDLAGGKLEEIADNSAQTKALAELQVKDVADLKAQLEAIKTTTEDKNSDEGTKITKENYKFVDWTYSEELKKAPETSTRETELAEKTQEELAKLTAENKPLATATWISEITLDLDGGAGVAETTIAASDAKALVAELAKLSPTKTGYKFVNWVFKKDGVFVEANETNLSGVTLAGLQIKANFSTEVSIDKNGGTTTSEFKEKIEVSSLAQLEEKLAEILEKDYLKAPEGFRFDKWTYFKVENSTETEITTPLAEKDLLNLKVKANYIQQFTVTLDANEGKFEDGKSKIEIAVDKDAQLPEGNIPTREGYQFDGWYTDKDLTTKFEGPVTKAETLYAKWLQASIVTFMDPETGLALEGKEPITIINGGTVPAEKLEISKDGYEFRGWFTDKDLKNAFDAKLPVTTNLTLYPKFVKKGSSSGISGGGSAVIGGGSASGSGSGSGTNKPADTDKKEETQKPEGTDTENTDNKQEAQKPSKELTVQTVKLPAVEESKEVNFKDISNVGWAQASINKLAKAGIINGDGAGGFNPQNNSKRADVAIMITKLLGLEGTATSNFNDVPSSKYYANYVGLVKDYGIVNGSNGNFNPEANISRQDTMVIMANILKQLGFEVNASTSSLGLFNDFNAISPYAQESVAILVNSGIITGSNGKINPKSDITRAEMSVIISKIYDLVEEKVKLTKEEATNTEEVTEKTEAEKTEAEKTESGKTETEKTETEKTETEKTETEKTETNK